MPTSRTKNKRHAKSDEDSTPSLQDVQRLLCMDQLVICIEDKHEMETIEVNDWCAAFSVLTYSFVYISFHGSVYVVHQGIDPGPQNDGHDYWKVKVASIHQGQNQGTWVIGLWFYSPSDLKDLDLCRQCVQHYGSYYYSYPCLFSFWNSQEREPHTSHGQHRVGLVR